MALDHGLIRCPRSRLWRSRLWIACVGYFPVSIVQCCHVLGFGRQSDYPVSALTSLIHWQEPLVSSLAACSHGRLIQTIKKIGLVLSWIAGRQKPNEVGS